MEDYNLEETVVTFSDEGAKCKAIEGDAACDYFADSNASDSRIMC